MQLCYTTKQGALTSIFTYAICKRRILPTITLGWHRYNGRGHVDGRVIKCEKILHSNATAMVPVRWRRTVQTILEKQPGPPWIHRLRIIELFDAQENADFLIYMGQNMMKHAVAKNLFRDESFGSTPGKMDALKLVQKLLSINQLRIERRASGLFDCDASGCYDRI